jgi:hypothetical protein
MKLLPTWYFLFLDLKFSKNKIFFKENFHLKCYFSMIFQKFKSE